jgi:hypothetical protein
LNRNFSGLEIATSDSESVGEIVPRIFAMPFNFPKPNMNFVDDATDALDPIRVFDRLSIILSPSILFPTETIFRETIKTAL